MKDIFVILRDSTLSVLRECGKDHFQAERTCWGRIFNTLKRRYLNYYTDDQANDILISSWVDVFLSKDKMKIKAFTGFNPKTGEKIAIETYLQFLLKNAIITNSTKESKVYSNEKQSFEDGGETSEERQDRLNLGSKGKKIYRVDDEEVSLYQGYLNDKLDALDKCRNNKRAFERLERQINDLRAQLDYLQQTEPKKKINVASWNEVYDENPDTDDVDDESTFNSYVNDILNRLKKKHQLILIALLGGVSHRSIAIFLGQPSIRKDLQHIINVIRDLGDELAFEMDDDSLYSAFEKYSKMSEDKEIKLTFTNESKGEIYRAVRAVLDEFLKRDKKRLRILIDTYFDDTDFLSI